MKVICHAKEILHNQGRTRRWLARETGISYSVLGDIVNNFYNSCRVDHAYAIAKALGKDIEEVFEFVEEEK